MSRHGSRGGGGVGGALTSDELINDLALALLLVKVYVTGDSTANTAC